MPTRDPRELLALQLGELMLQILHLQGEVDKLRAENEVLKAPKPEV